MSQISLNYERVERQLASADVENTASEVHGVLCGLLCGGAADAERTWMGELMPDDAAEGDLLLGECMVSLAALFKETDAAVADTGFEFSAFLPDDDKNLTVRGRAVADWCQGYLYGLGLSGADGLDKLSGDAGEALQSLSEVSQMDVAALQANEEDEFALAEVIEFIWVAAMLIRSELVGDGGAQA